MNSDRPLQKFYLALSGGGFRATIFHLGVVRYLREAGRLKDVERIASVSGGSIFAAHLVLHWDRYSGDESQFKSAAQEIIGFVGGNVRGRIFGPWLWLWLWWLSAVLLTAAIVEYWEWSWLGRLFLVVVFATLFVVRLWIRLPRGRIQRLQSVYENDLFRGQRLKDLLGDDRPHLWIAATDLTSGSLAYFSGKGVHLDVDPSRDLDASDDLIEVGDMPIAFAVAASSAFPPVFPPVRLSRGLLDVDMKRLRLDRYLSDGGVYDNLGAWLASAVPSSAVELVVSSAEPLPDDATGAFKWLATRAERATNILMQRVSDMSIQVHSSARVIRLDRDVDHQPFDGSVQRRVRTIRTDLNAFNAVEIQTLYCKGYLAAEQAFGETLAGKFEFAEGIPMDASTERWLPIPKLDRGLNLGMKTLAKSATTRYFGRRECCGLFLGAAPLLLMAFLWLLSGLSRPGDLSGQAFRWNDNALVESLTSDNEWLNAFVSDAESRLQACDLKPWLAGIITAPLANAFWLRQRPNEFTCQIACELPDTSVMACQPFIVGADGRISRVLELTRSEAATELQFVVTDPKRGDKIFVLVGLCGPLEEDVGGPISLQSGLRVFSK